MGRSQGFRKRMERERRTEGLRAIIGGPAYQMKLDARHAGSMVALALGLRSAGMSYFETHWSHGCPVEAARNGLFKHALESTADVLFWADADVFWHPEDTGSIVWLMGELVAQRYPCVALPVMQRNGDSNIVERIEGAGAAQMFHRIRSFGDGPPIRECAAAGTGAIAFYLPWYREHWSEAPWFRTEWHGAMSVSEDLWHTSQLKRAHGVPMRFAPIVRTNHEPRGVQG